MDRLVVTMPTNRLNILSSFCFIIVSVLIAGCARNLGINEVEHVNSDSVEENQSNYTNLEVDDAGCIQPVNSIAYQSNYIFGVSEDQIPFPSVDTFISPTKPWHTELELPELQSDNEIVSHVEVTRTWNDQVEIWIARSSPFDIFQYDIYLPENGSWKLAVSRYVDNTDVRISMLYVLSDGSIWAKNIWSEQIESSKDYFPILSKFNEKTRQFEFVDSMQGIPGLRDFHESLVEVAVDNQDVFWILVEGDAIYSYSSHLKKSRCTQRFQKQVYWETQLLIIKGFYTSH